MATLQKRFSLSPDRIKERLRYFGFTEVDEILKFISIIDAEDADASGYTYIRARLDRCLRNHDNGDDYFIPLREIASELDCCLHEAASRNI